MKKALIYSIAALCGLAKAQNESIEKMIASFNDARLHDTVRLIAIEKAGNSYFLLNPDSALSCFNQELNFAIKTKQLRFEINALNSIGSIYYSKQDFPSSLSYFKNSLSLSEKAGEKGKIAIALKNLGLTYEKIGNRKRAVEHLKTALEINEEIKNYPEIIACNKLLASITYQNEYYYQDIVRVCEHLNDKAGLAEAYQLFGDYYSKSADHAQLKSSVEYYRKGLLLYDETGVKMGVTHCKVKMAKVIPRLEYEKYYAENKKYSFKENLKILNKASKIEDKAYKKSVKIVEESLPLYKAMNDIEGQALCYEILSKAKSFKTIKSMDKAFMHELASRRLRNKLMKREDSLELYRRYFKEEFYSRERTLFGEELKLSPRSEDAYFALIRLWKLVYPKLHLIHSLTESEKSSYLSSMKYDFSYYYQFAHLHHKKYPGLADTAYNLVLAYKGLLLKSSTALRSAILKSNDTALIRRYDNWLQLKKQIADACKSEVQIEGIEDKANELERALIKQSVFKDFRYTGDVSWKTVQSKLRSNEAAIEFVSFNAYYGIEYMALVIRKESAHPEVVWLCKENEIQDILGNTPVNDESFVSKLYGTHTQAQTKLYEKLWQPLEPYLKNAENIYYAPDALLHKISFSAIGTGTNTVLSDKYNLILKSSTAKVGPEVTLGHFPVGEFILAGGINYNSTATESEIWNYLPGTLTEVANIRNDLKKRNIKVTYLTGEKALEDTLKRIIPKAEVLHVATHGYFFPEPEVAKNKPHNTTEESKDPASRISENYAEMTFINNKNPLMRSGIVLARANDVWQRDAQMAGEDGVLTAQEVSSLDMQNTKLVVLSACETGLGDIKNGEGVYGLQRAFKMAGVKNIIMSLWQVPDNETSEFMVGFYKRLSSNGDISQAFMNTQKEMRKKYDPFFWAAFVLVE